MRQALEDVADGAERVRVIVRDLRIMSRPQPEQRAPVDVNGALETAVGFAGNELRHRARVVWDLGPVPPVSANEARLGQVFLNLMVNAAQALPEQDAAAQRDPGGQPPRGQPGGRRGGRQRGGHPARAPAPPLRSLLHHQAGRQGHRAGALHLPRHRDRPGRADRRRQRGGPGQHLPGGAPGGAARPTRDPAPVQPGRAGGPRGRILVLDDEEQVGKSIRRVLNEDHEVVCARNVREALALLEAAGAFDVVLCDLMMPGLTGMKEFYSEVKDRHPEFTERIVFMAGTSTPAGDAFLARTGNRCIEKPCDPANLRAVVAELVAQHRSPRRAAG